MFWVGMLVVTVVAQLPGALQKCIFDEVQSQVKAVRAAPSYPDSPPNEPSLRPPTGKEHPLTSGRQTGQTGGRRTLPPFDLASKQKRSLGTTTVTVPAPPQPIRIRTWIPRESDDLSDTEKTRLTSAVVEAVRTVSSLLSVNRVVGPLLLNRDVNKYCKFIWSNSKATNYKRCGRANSNYRNETCLDVTIPDDHLAGCDIYSDPDSPHRTVLRPEGAGLADTDFLLYLHIKSTNKCRAEPNVFAFAVHCQTDGRGRPVAGVVVICRDRLTEAAYDHQATIQTVIHELFHVLGFSKDLFHTWTDCSSSSEGDVRCSPRGKVIHSDGSGQMRIYTSSVISSMQKHLTSTDPELGGPLENLDVPSGRVSSHWETRVLRGSIMAAVLGDPTTVRIDSVTLAALEDTGWYTVDLSRAQNLVWGDGEGAMFGSLSTCQDNSSSFFCTGSGSGCHFLHLHKGTCQTDPYLEGCRVFKPLNDASECWKQDNSRQTSGDDWSGEIFGFDSRCFFSNLTRRTHTHNQSFVLSSSVQGCCYRHRCTGPNQYHIQVSGSEWTDCPAGGTIQIKGYHGLVFCPDRRFCLYPDISPSSDDINTFPASYTREPYVMVTSAQDGNLLTLRPPIDFTVVPVLCVTAAVCVLAALAVFYSKCCSCSIRIHTVPEDHNNP